MWVRAVRRMSCTVKWWMSCRGRGRNATFSVSGLMWPKRFRLGTPPFMWISRRGGNRYSLLHENTWTPSSHRRTGAASGVERPDGRLQVELGPPGRQQLHLAHAQGEQQPHGQLVLATEVGRVLHGLGECGKFLAVQPALS